MSSSPQIWPRFEGKTVLVTGAGTGFGAEIAFRAAQEGAKVAVHYRSSKAGAEATVARIEAIGAEAITVQADIGTWEAIKKMADEVWAAFGTLDVLVNNVGDVSSEQMSWRDLTQEALDAVELVREHARRKMDKERVANGGSLPSPFFLRHGN